MAAGTVVVVEGATTTSSPDARPRTPDLGETELAGLDSLLASVFTSALASDFGSALDSETPCLANASGEVSAFGFSLDFEIAEGVGKLVTILTAISFVTALGLLSKIRGKPTTAMSTKTAAPIRR